MASAATAAVAVLRRTSASRHFLVPSFTASLCNQIVSLSLEGKNNDLTTNTTNNAVNKMYMSSFARRGGGRGGGGRGGGEGGVPRHFNPRLRTHAVSVVHGNYDDYNNDDDETYEDAFPLLPEAAGDLYEENEVLHFEEDELELDRDAREALAKEEELQVLRKKWMENAKPPKRFQKLDNLGRSYARGSRKTSSARVWIEPGMGLVSVNKRDFVECFHNPADRDHILGPFVATETCGLFDVYATVQGGGTTGQAGAIRLGIARALQNFNPDYRPPMKRLGFMTRDPRKVERKKIGLKKARKAPQWVRR
mmetsp:Transcript_15263/g.22469  ORF Transcript_15263/g.22469 Transcript_15263/m.22469 type:complete len:308 (+) Transcript_15263:81-1004(+)